MKSRTFEIVLVRHGETAWSRSGQHTGRTDIPLLEEGRGMGRALGAPLRAWRFDTVWTSPLRRASETCALAGYGGVAEQRSDLMEWDYGAYEGRTAGEIRAVHPGWVLWRDGVPGGETAQQVGTRVERVIAELRALGGHALLFAHGHVLRVLAARWVGLPPTEGRLFALSTASVSVLGWNGEGTQPVIVSWNDTTHLRE